ADVPGGSTGSHLDHSGRSSGRRGRRQKHAGERPSIHRPKRNLTHLHPHTNHLRLLSPNTNLHPALHLPKPHQLLLALRPRLPGPGTRHRPPKLHPLLQPHEPARPAQREQNRASVYIQFQRLHRSLRGLQFLERGEQLHGSCLPAYGEETGELLGRVCGCGGRGVVGGGSGDGCCAVEYVV
ncbi:hypothetical protein LTR87_003040, partial [Friedmanniomyces endolithicus]